MEKSIATETIMKIFIMIAVILIAGSFLLKAFNIDILGFLKGKLGELAMKGKALHIKLDGTEVWEFHLTNENVHSQEDRKLEDDIYFSIRKDYFDGGNCLIFVTDENGGGDDDDDGYILYTNPGTIIQDGSCTSVGGCVQKNSINSGNHGCDFFQRIDPYDTTRQTKFTIITEPFTFYNACMSIDEAYNWVMSIPFTSNPHDWKCGQCDLLMKDQYIVKYGLICDQKGYWQACTEGRAKGTGEFVSIETTTPGGTKTTENFRCKLDGTKGKWVK